MAYVGQPRYIPFIVSDSNGGRVAGLHLADFTVTFTRSGSPCADILAVTDFGDGTYELVYTPSGTGRDYVELVKSSPAVRVIDIEEITVAPAGGGGGGGGPVPTTSVVSLDHNYGGSDHLRITTPDPDEWRLYVYTSDGWQSGQRDPGAALGSAGLDAQGRWLAQIAVLPGKVHVVIVAAKETEVAFPFLTVTAS